MVKYNIIVTNNNGNYYNANTMMVIVINNDGYYSITSNPTIQLILISNLVVTGWGPQ